MKNLITTLFVTFCFALTCYSQEKKEDFNIPAKDTVQVQKVKLEVSYPEEERKELETTSPLLNTELTRKVKVMDLDGKYFMHTKITLKSINSFYHNVKVTVFDLSNKKDMEESYKRCIPLCIPKWASSSGSTKL